MKHLMFLHKIVGAIFLLVLSHTQLNGQVSLDRYVLSFAANTYKSGGLALDATAGDLAVTTTQNGPLALYQGFQQGYPEGLSSDISTHVQFIVEGMRVFPNPTQGDLHLSLSLTEGVDLRVLIYNAEGKLVLEESLGKVHKLERRVDLNPFANGLFLLKLTNPKGQVLGKIKLIKW